MANRNIFSSLLHPKAFNQKNGFDLSHRKVFPCKAGELLPVLCEELYPDDYFEIDTATLLRTMPLQTAAFLRARMCFDFFFVPKTALWRRYNAFISQRDTFDSSYEQGFQYEPNITLATLNSQVLSNHGNYTDTQYDRARVLQLLGYADGMVSLPTGIDGSRSLSVLPILGYNRIYDFHYRNKWRDIPGPSDMKCNNADWLDCSTFATSLFPQYDSTNPYQLIRMHYHGWFKDLFMGSLPNQQFGVVSSVNTVGLAGWAGNTSFDNGRWIGQTSNIEWSDNKSILTRSLSSAPDSHHLSFDLTGSGDYRGIKHDHTFTLNVAGQNVSSFDVLSLRRALALQKWKEYNMRAGWQPDRQQQANFGVDLPSDARHEIQFLDSYEAPIMIDEVLQNSPSAAVSGVTSSATPVGDLGGKGIGFNNGKKIKYNANQPGYLYCIFYIMPEAEYDADMIDPTLVASEPFDHYTPAFANLGMESIPKWAMSYKGNPNVFDNVYGYAPNGWKWKTRLDKVYSDFQYNRGFQSWVSTRRDLQNIVNSGSIPTTYFYVNPSCLDTIFYAANNGQDDSCQFLVNLNFQTKAVRPMPVLGLPSF